MSIYIKDMVLPKNEPLLVKINPDGSVSTTARNGYQKYKAVPIPEHGDLIDKDALPTSRVEWEDIVNAPIIIPASEEGEV